MVKSSVLIVVNEFNDYGGIINHTEHLMRGMKSFPHKVDCVDLVCLKASKRAAGGWPTRRASTWAKNERGIGSNLPVSLKKGWNAPCYSYLNKQDRKDFIKRANKYSMVIWTSPFGFANSKTIGRREVLDVFKLSNTVTQLAVIHDGNFLTGYPWLAKMAYDGHLNVLVGVHESSYNSARETGCPSVLIGNPHDLSAWDERHTSHKKDPRAFGLSGNKRDLRQIFSLQVFKRWKRVDELVRSVIHFKQGNQGIKVKLAGDGIERRYMASKEKCRPCYKFSSKVDPIAPKGILGKPIWGEFLKRGHEWLGVVNDEERSHHIDKSSFLIDPSWSKTYGGHFNRTLCEAMARGTVPIARNLGISHLESGVGTFFAPSTNYLMVPYNATPEEFATKLQTFCDMSSKEYKTIVENNIQVLKDHFEESAVAEAYLTLNEDPFALSENAWNEEKVEAFKKIANKAYRAHFCAKTSE